MGINLAKNQKISLTKSDGQGLRQVFVGLGWDVVKKSGGFFGGLMGGGGGDIDLDASCLMFDANKNIVDAVWFRQLRSKDGSVIHSGDNLTGAGDGDDEVITVDLTRVPANVQSLVFVICSFRGQTFETVESAFCRIVNKESNTELGRYNLSAKNRYTAQVMAKVFRENGVWQVQTIGEPANGSTYQELIPVAQRFL